jgi:hypothetical protein
MLKAVRTLFDVLLFWNLTCNFQDSVRVGAASSSRAATLSIMSQAATGILADDDGDDLPKGEDNSGWSATDWSESESDAPANVPKPRPPVDRAKSIDAEDVAFWI